MLSFLFKHLSKFFVIGDFIIINLIFVIGKFYFFKNETLYFFDTYKAELFIINIFWLAITLITKQYSDKTINESSLHFNALTKSLALFTSISLFYLTFILSLELNYVNIIFYFIIVIFLMFALRVVLFLFRKKYRASLGEKRYAYNTVLIGINKLSELYLENNDIKKSLGIRGVYSITDNTTSKYYLGNIDQLIKDFETQKISKIIFCDDSISIESYKKIVSIAELKMIRVYITPNFEHSILGPYYLDHSYDVPLLKMIKEPLSNPKKQFIKRTFDIIFSLFVIVFILSWLVPIVALIIKIESGETAFFFQKRSGLNNVPFNCIKFRSMKTNTVADVKMVTKNDNRITKFGAFIRKTSIDELPQFINVLIGDMSIVGPRPHMISQTEIYSKITEKYMTRHIVKPGITGWAQVMGARGEIFCDIDMQKRVKKDIWYIQNWSFFLDIKIIFLTVYNVIKGDEQAY